jgi:predicted dehydrogenase
MRENREPEPQGPVRIALLGTGSIAQVVHLPILSGLPGVVLQGIADVDRPRAKAIAERLGVPRLYESDEEAFASAEVDAVVICTPSHLHEEQAIAAMRAGKHVLVEKPLAFDAAAAERVCQVAEETGRCLMVAMNNRYRPDIQALKPFARGGELGELFLMKAGWLNRKIRMPRPTWRHRLETAGGGALMDLGTQVLDLALWTLDYPPVERVVAELHPGEGMEVEDAATLMVWVRNGPVLSVEMTWSLLAERDRHYLQILGTGGAASIAPLSVNKEVEHGLLDVTPQIAPGRENLYTASYRQVLSDFVAKVQSGAPVAPPWEQVELMRLIQLAYQSAREGQAVMV